MLSLRSIDQSNWEACIQLKPKQEQEEFIASNLYSIAESKFLPQMKIKAIYCGEILIGFAMYGIDSDDGNYWIYRFMIDEQFQGRGHGKGAMKLIIEDIRSRDDRTDVILLGYHPDNEQARKLYASMGFKESGMAPWGEMLAKYSFY
ncbi:N-acetyltransferase [Lysinibacillus sp. Ag94]|uniref:GNAT family N-acetyltransferase n=1 Tax=Lysinibacillus sp. Ag94 TaxID=2936682 RepID=UPI0020103C57|nr:GNAT family N-acetyltransferase [Lysinibacillus sp. Ag94]UPW84469.1 GNAT family N-acetyltransferase [Lysinibacillus sp. Ag94]